MTETHRTLWRVSAGPRPLPALALILACLLFPTPVSAEGEDASALRPRVVELLESLLADPPAEPAEVLAAIRKLGAGAVPVVHSYRHSFEEGIQIRVAARALAALGDSGRDEFLLGFVDGPADLNLQRAAFDVLGRSGSDAALHRLVGLLGKNEPTVKRSAERAVTALLRRHGTSLTYSGLSESFRTLSVESRARLISCIAEAGSPDGLRFLGDLVGWYPELDLSIVAGISKMPMTEENRDIVPKLRELLDDEDSNVRRECVTALGMMRDAESVQVLIDLLADQGGGVPGNANWALQNISGLRFPPDPDIWKHWLAEENAWWEGEGSRCLADLSSGRRQDILRALHLLARRPLFRDRVKERITALLKHEDGEVRAAAAAAFGRLGFTGAGGGSIASIGGLGGGGWDSGPGPASGAGRSGGPSREGVDEEEDSGSTVIAVFGVAILLVLLASLFGWSFLDRVKHIFGRRPAEPAVKSLKDVRRPPRRG